MSIQQQRSPLPLLTSVTVVVATHTFAGGGGGRDLFGTARTKDPIGAQGREAILTVSCFVSPSQGVPVREAVFSRRLAFHTYFYVWWPFEPLLVQPTQMRSPLWIWRARTPSPCHCVRPTSPTAHATNYLEQIHTTFK